MVKSHRIAFVKICLAVTSCRTGIEERIIGKWLSERAIVTSRKITSVDSTMRIINFETGGKYHTIVNGKGAHGRWSTKKNSTNEKESLLTVTIGDKSTKYNIVTLGENELVLQETHVVNGHQTQIQVSFKRIRM
jgi:hypothetical protein